MLQSLGKTWNNIQMPIDLQDSYFGEDEVLNRVDGSCDVLCIMLKKSQPLYSSERDKSEEYIYGIPGALIFL